VNHELHRLQRAKKPGLLRVGRVNREK
jgi:hypothetical protein